MKYIELFNLSESLKNLGNMILPAKEGIKISRFMRKILPSVEEYLIERDKLTVTHGDPQENGTYIIRNEEKKEYSDKLKDLNEMDVGIDLSDIEVIEINNNISMQPNMLYHLQDFVKII